MMGMFLVAAAVVFLALSSTYLIRGIINRDGDMVVMGFPTLVAALLLFMVAVVRMTGLPL